MTLANGKIGLGTTAGDEKKERETSKCRQILLIIILKIRNILFKR
jgi:hypothetical protein